MATTTPNYGWTVPTSTDLVKDGATAIETLGDAIDASMNTALGTKKAGMVLLNTTSFSGVASTSLTADTFTSAYTNYKILIRITNTTAGEMRYRFRAAGSDDTNNNYNSQFLVADSTGVTGARVINQNTGLLGYLGLNETSFFDITFFSPKASSRSAVQSYESREHGGTNVIIQHHFSNFNNTTSFDSMTFIPQAGAITGTYSVYGFNI